MSRRNVWLCACLLLTCCVLPMLAQQPTASTPNVAGTGTQDYVPLWLDNAGTLGNSVLYQSGTGSTARVGINTTTPRATLGVNGSVSANGFLIGAHLFAFGSYANANAFLGFAGNATTTGFDNTATGFQALNATTTGHNNTANGYQALLANTMGNSNTADGDAALYTNTTGSYNTACGVDALYFNTTGGNNTASGDLALYTNTTGSNNTGSGIQALYWNSTGYANTALGWNAGPDEYSTNLTYATAIGAGATVSESNALVLGGPLGSGYNVKVGIGTATPSNVFTIAQGGGQAIGDGWTTYSSRRWKTNIHTLHDALAKVEQLRGVSYDLKANGQHEVGVIAEEVGAVVPEVVTWEKNGKDAQSVDYGRLTALLIEATKEQQTLIREQKEQIRAQQAQIVRLTRQVKTIQATLKANGPSGSAVRTVAADGRAVRQ